MGQKEGTRANYCRRQIKKDHSAWTARGPSMYTKVKNECSLSEEQENDLQPPIQAPVANPKPSTHLQNKDNTSNTPVYPDNQEGNDIKT